MFPLIAFTADTVANLTGLSIYQVHRWDRTGFFAPSLRDGEDRRPHARVYSFQDVVGLRTVAKLRAAGVSFPELKKVRRLFASPYNEDWTNRRFYVVGMRVFFTHQDAIVAATPLGQQVETAILEVGPIVADVERAVRQLPIRVREQIGRISRDRWIMNGVPVIAGTRIPTATIVSFHRSGLPIGEILLEYPRLTTQDVRAAIEFEDAREAEEKESLKALA